jgi:mono/diheme cytochrome c family protein
VKTLSVLIVVALAFPAFGDAGPDAAALYKSNCVICHGADGAGKTPAGKALKVRDLRSAEVQKMSDKELFTVIVDGKGSMPAFKSKLSQVDIDALVGFIRQLARK